jgi:NAD-dependent SIR2 family protein deacetylase
MFMDRLGRLLRLLCASLCLFAGLLAPVCLKAEDPSNSLFTPKTCSAEELTQMLKEKGLDMCWNFGPDSYLRFTTENEDVYFEIVAGTLPPGYDEFLTRFQDKFIKTEKQRTFSYKLQKDGSEAFHLLVNARQVKPEEYSYIVTERRILENAHPQQLTQAQLIELIKSKNILFYTGAGLSLGSGVPAMAELQELLGLEASEKFLFSLEKALVNPREFASKILTFHKACLNSPPTPAHLALKELAALKNTRIFTENLDALHETSGISPYRIDPNQLRQETDEVTFRAFDYIICVGLSYDDRGFLAWYKEKNPQGKIIAIDLKQPSYLGDEDFLVTGDIQKILPAVHQAFAPN